VLLFQLRQIVVNVNFVVFFFIGDERHKNRVITSKDLRLVLIVLHQKLFPESILWTMCRYSSRMSLSKLWKLT